MSLYLQCVCLSICRFVSKRHYFHLMSNYLCDSISESGGTGRWGPFPITFALQSPPQEIVPEDISSVRVQFTYLTLSDRTCYFTMFFIIAITSVCDLNDV